MTHGRTGSRAVEGQLMYILATGGKVDIKEEILVDGFVGTVLGNPLTIHERLRTPMYLEPCLVNIERLVNEIEAPGLVDITHGTETISLVGHIVAFAEICHSGLSDGRHVLEFQIHSGGTTKAVCLSEFLVLCQNLALRGFPNQEWALLDSTENLTDTLDETLRGDFGRIGITVLQLGLHLIDGDILGNILLGETIDPAIFPTAIAVSLLHDGKVKANTVSAEGPAPEKTKCLLLDCPAVKEVADFRVVLADFPLITDLDAHSVLLNIECGC